MKDFTVYKTIQRLLRDARGVSAVEFALIAPFMILLLLGTVELADVMLADRKVTTITSTTADLVAQAIEITDGEIADVFSASSAIMNPFDPNSLQIVVTSVNIDNTNMVVGWSDGFNASAHAPGSAFALPPGLGSDGDSVIVGEVSYTHTSVVGDILGGSKTVTDIFYMQPRRTLRIQRVP
jgi:Flp pilus assembly protein TadG